MAKQGLRFLLAALVLVPSLYVLLAAATQNGELDLSADRQFSRRDLASTAYLFDLGVADINDDSWLDIYTTNHGVRPLILVNEAGKSFADRVLDLKLSTNRSFVGADQTLEQAPPTLDAPGLYIYWTLNEFVIRAHRLPEDRPASGIVLARETEIATTDGSVRVTEHAAEGERVAPFSPERLDGQVKAFQFTAHGDSTLRIHSYIGYNVASVHIRAPTPLEHVFIGRQRINPLDRTFVLWPDDRHSMIWFDLNGDAVTDVITVDGGMSGRSRGRVEPEHASYHPFLRSRDEFRESSLGGDLHRYGCPTRHASLADVDRDGWLDLYVVCGRSGEGYANQLFRQRDSGAFSEIAAEMHLDLPRHGPAAWVDVDDDGDLDLVAATGNDLQWFRNDGQRFAAQPIGRVGRAATLSVSDFDRDGDFDVFVAAPEGSRLLLNEHGRYRAVAAEEKGLPKTARCANWVDYDNDGLIDLHALPGGIFRQHEGERFERTGLLAAERDGAAFCTWADFDNDGYRDLLVAQSEPASLRQRLRNRVARMLGREGQLFIAENPVLFSLEGVLWGHTFREYPPWRLSLYRNVGAGHRWLAVQLRGSEGNRPALGARITVETATGIQTQQVGEAEGSVRSQGHYRAYFGLGADNSVDTLRVVWPDGTEEEHHAVPSNQFLILEKASRSDVRAATGGRARHGSHRLAS